MSAHRALVLTSLPLLLAAQPPASTMPEASDVAVPKPAYGVLLVTVDCLRPDHMSVFGYERDTTPNLRALAGESVLFTEAYATSGWTSPGVVSLLTGYFPPVHAQTGRFSYYDEMMSSPLWTLRQLRTWTVGFTDSGPTFADLGFRAGLSPITSPEAFIEAMASTPTLASGLTWMHLREVHMPRDAPAEFDRWGEPSSASSGVAAARSSEVVFRGDGEPSFDEGDRQVMVDLYDAEVSQVDARLGKLVQALRDEGLLDQTILVITADHGEELLEHGWVGHASTSHVAQLYDEVMHIPLIIRVPGGSPTGRVAELVQQTDVMPTLFDLLGVDPGLLPVPMQGRSLVPLMRGEQGGWEDRPVYAQTTMKGWTTPVDEYDQRLTALRTEQFKLLRRPDGSFELYDVVEDPGEKHDLAGRKKRVLADMEQLLDETEAANAAVAQRLVTDAGQRRLDALRAALDQGDIAAAAEHYAALRRIERTWGLEPGARLSGAPEEWTQLLGEARQLFVQAVGGEP